MRATIDTMRFQAREKTVGGPVDVLVITPGEAKWIARKELRAAAVAPGRPKGSERRSQLSGSTMGRRDYGRRRVAQAQRA